MANQHRKHEILTIPNMMSFARLALVPLILYFYLGPKLYGLSAILVIVSSLSDIFDGFIARKLNQVTELGKLLDPVADKLTQGVMILCLISRYPLMIAVIILFIIKESLMIVFGMKNTKKNGEFVSAKWFGKLNTVIVEGTILTMLIFVDIPLAVATVLMVLSIISLILSMSLYLKMFIELIKNGEKN